ARELELIMRQAAERNRLARELAVLRAEATPSAPVGASGGVDGAALARVLKELGRMLAAGFDLPRMAEMFLDAVGELLRPTRSALLLPDEDGQTFRVAAHRGLARPIVEAVRLPASQGLSQWLVTQGRPARRQELIDPDTARELALLQGVVAVPLLSHGE